MYIHSRPTQAWLKPDYGSSIRDKRTQGFKNAPSPRIWFIATYKIITLMADEKLVKLENELKVPFRIYGLSAYL